MYICTLKISMNIETIKGNINRKIERYLKDDNLTFPEIAQKITTTKDNFQKLLDSDVNSSARLHMLTQYIAFSEKRIRDIEFVDDIVTNKFFAGITDIDAFKLIKLRDKVSQDVIEGNFY
jgi:hypothetical protein